MGRLIARNRGLFSGAALCTLVAVAADYCTPLLLAETLDHYLSGLPTTLPAFVNRWVEALGGPDYMAKHLWIMGLALVALSALSGLCNFLRGRWQSQAGENVARDLRTQLYDHIQRLPFSYHVKAETGDLVQRCTSDVDTVRKFLINQLMSILSALLMIAVALTVLLRRNARLALYSMIMVPGLFLFAYLFFKWVVKAFRASDEAEGAMSAVLQENLTGVRVVRAFGRQQYEVEKFREKSLDFKEKTYRLCRLLNVYWSVSDGMSMLQSCLTLAVCVIFAVRGEITVGTLVVFTSFIGKLLWPIRQLGRILSDAGKSFVSLERMKDMSFTIPAGKTVAILGATGSGKSSVVHLLQRLFKPQSGRITIGGVDIQTIDRNYLRSRVGLVLQEPFLYSKTLRDNVGIAVREPEAAKIEQAARDAAALGFILDSESGWDTLVGERGVTLSGGQKQRVAIARTLMKDNDILIFDDSLSAVDTETDAEIRRALKERSRDTTTIIISHRIVTLSQADLILVMEDGRVTQQGTHRELIAQDGLYSRIFNIQTALEAEFAEEVN